MCVHPKLKWRNKIFLASVVKKCANDDIEWRIVISQELPLPPLIHLLIRPFDMIQFYIQSLIYGDRHSSLWGGDTTHQHTEHANFTEPIPMRCSHLNLQFFQHWIKSRVCDLSAEEECMWLVWCLDLSGLSVPALSARQIGEGSPGSPDRQLITSEYYLANLVFSRISSTIRNGSFHSPSSQFSAQQRSEISKLNK